MLSADERAYFQTADVGDIVSSVEEQVKAVAPLPGALHVLFTGALLYFHESVSHEPFRRNGLSVTEIPKHRSSTSQMSTLI